MQLTQGTALELGFVAETMRSTWEEPWPLGCLLAALAERWGEAAADGWPGASGARPKSMAPESSAAISTSLRSPRQAIAALEKFGRQFDDVGCMESTVVPPPVPPAQNPQTSVDFRGRKKTAVFQRLADLSGLL
jgi:hypothetical protein